MTDEPSVATDHPTAETGREPMADSKTQKRSRTTRSGTKAATPAPSVSERKGRSGEGSNASAASEKSDMAAPRSVPPWLKAAGVHKGKAHRAAAAEMFVSGSDDDDEQRAVTHTRTKGRAGLRARRVRSHGGSAKEAKNADDEADELMSASTSDSEQNNLLRGAVKVFTTINKPNHAIPWQNESQTSCTGSGCLLEGRRVLTNAHVAEYAASITVLKHGSAKRYLAKVVHLGNTYDLAILRVEEDEDEFWADVIPFQLANFLPPLQSDVVCVGYPTDIDSVSITAGVVSRVLVETYSQSNVEMLKLQVDAAINPGNSGGPAVVGGYLAGVVFEVEVCNQGIGYIIPASVVQHFLDQIERHGKVRGICELGLVISECENPSLRTFLHLAKGDHGAVVRRVRPTSVCKGKLQPDDVITHIDAIEVADDSTVELRASGERVPMSHLISSKHVGESCSLTFKRAGKTMHADIKLDASESELVPYLEPSATPRYLVWSGLVFLAVSDQYIEASYHHHNEGQMPIAMRERSLRGERERADDDLVILSQVLADPLTRGYVDISDRVVLRLNGQPIRNLAQVHAALANIDAKTHPFVRVDLDDDDIVVLDTAKAIEAHPVILMRNRIHHASHLDAAPPMS